MGMLHLELETLVTCRDTCYGYEQVRSFKLRKKIILLSNWRQELYDSGIFLYLGRLYVRVGGE